MPIDRGRENSESHELGLRERITLDSQDAPAASFDMPKQRHLDGDGDDIIFAGWHKPDDEPGEADSRTDDPVESDSGAKDADTADARPDDPGRLRDIGKLARDRIQVGERHDGGDHPAAKTWLESDNRPPPLESTRTYHKPGYLKFVLPPESKSLEQAVPRDNEGNPLRFPHPEGEWTSKVNDSGPRAMPFRANNCLDCSLSAVSTWHGEPRVSAQRNHEYDAKGDPLNQTGETDGRARAESWLGHKYEAIGPDASAYADIERRLMDAGHGASAAIINNWPWGGAHAWNAFNHDGKVYWVDTQQARVADQPIYSTPGAVEAIIMDNEGKKA